MTSSAPVVWGAVVVAAGLSERFGQSDKLSADLCGMPVIGRSIAAMSSDSRIRHLVLVCSMANAVELGASLARRPGHCRIDSCLGGRTRSESVRCGLRALDDEVNHVAIHDGARPLVSTGLVSRLLDVAEVAGAAVPALPVSSSLGVAECDGRVLAGTVDRSRLRELQTPQAARRDYLTMALAEYPDETDESAALFCAGHQVSLVPGEPANIKITVPEDLLVAAALLRSRGASS